MNLKGKSAICGICACPNAINHFGALACRACAAFFRRLVVSGRRYNCECEEKPGETGEERKRRVLNCRGCRLRRCLENGMDPKAVRSAHFHAFHKERMEVSHSQQVCPMQMAVIEPEEAYEVGIVEAFMEIEGRATQVLLNSQLGFGSEELGQFKCIEDLLFSRDNLLANEEYLKTTTIDFGDIDLFEQNLAKWGLWHRPPRGFIRHLLISINIAKALPAFSKIGLNDQVASVKKFVLAACHFLGRFYSVRRGARTSVLENTDYPLTRLYTKWMDTTRDPIVEKLAKVIFELPLEDFLRIEPSREEFGLLMALLYTNPAIPGLSKAAQNVMTEESEKYSRVLLRLQQRRFGAEAGSLRYVGSLQLLWNTIATAQKHAELIVYIDSIHEQGSFEAVMPKILVPFVIE